jgi:hypothetical protein
MSEQTTKLAELHAQADALKPRPRLRALISGRPSTGKTHLILSAPKPVVVLYCDRQGGEEDLEKAASDGVFRVYLRRGAGGRRIADQVTHWIQRITSGDLSGEGIQTIALDSLSYLQSLVQVESVQQDKQTSQRDFGRIAQGMEKILLDLLTMDQHILITSHLKSKQETGKDPETGADVPLTIWQPDAMPKVREIVMREVGLMGYTWRKTSPEGESRFGVNFTEASRSRTQLFQFQDAKAPQGWGGNEPADMTEWIGRLWPAPVAATPSPDPAPVAPKPTGKAGKP